MLLLSSESFSEGRNLITKAHNVSQMATPIVYVAIKLRNKSKNDVSPERSEGGERAMKQFIEELKLILKVHRTLGLIGSVLAICYLLFANGFHPISQLNND